MKKIWKFLGFTALAAALVPCRVEQDEESGRKTYRSLLYKMDIGPGKNGEGKEIALSLTDGVIPSALRAKRAQSAAAGIDADDAFEADVDEEDFCDEPEILGEPVLDISLTVHKAQPCETAKASEEPAAPETPETEA